MVFFCPAGVSGECSNIKTRDSKTETMSKSLEKVQLNLNETSTDSHGSRYDSLRLSAPHLANDICPSFCLFKFLTESPGESIGNPADGVYN